jgi:hypothetical protein
LPHGNAGLLHGITSFLHGGAGFLHGDAIKVFGRRKALFYREMGQWYRLPRKRNAEHCSARSGFTFPRRAMLGTPNNTTPKKWQCPNFRSAAFMPLQPLLKFLR